jgi:hypothetical protein
VIKEPDWTFSFATGTPFIVFRPNSHHGVFVHAGKLLGGHYDDPGGTTTHSSSPDKEDAKSNSLITALTLHVANLGVDSRERITPPGDLNRCLRDAVNIADIVFSSSSERSSNTR